MCLCVGDWFSIFQSGGLKGWCKQHCRVHDAEVQAKWKAMGWADLFFLFKHFWNAKNKYGDILPPILERLNDLKKKESCNIAWQISFHSPIADVWVISGHSNIWFSRLPEQFSGCAAQVLNAIPIDCLSNCTWAELPKRWLWCSFCFPNQFFLIDPFICLFSFCTCGFHLNASRQHKVEKSLSKKQWWR